MSEKCTSDTVVAIVGNKVDREEETTVDTTEGQAVAEDHNALFFETSAKTGLNINQLFQSIADRIVVKVDSNLESSFCLTSNTKSPTTTHRARKRHC